MHPVQRLRLELTDTSIAKALGVNRVTVRRRFAKIGGIRDKNKKALEGHVNTAIDRYHREKNKE